MLPKLLYYQILLSRAEFKVGQNRSTPRNHALTEASHYRLKTLKSLNFGLGTSFLGDKYGYSLQVKTFITIYCVSTLFFCEDMYTGCKKYYDKSAFKRCGIKPFIFVHTIKLIPLKVIRFNKKVMSLNKIIVIENDPNITSLNDRLKSRLCASVKITLRYSAKAFISIRFYYLPNVFLLNVV